MLLFYVSSARCPVDQSNKASAKNKKKRNEGVDTSLQASGKQYSAAPRFAATEVKVRIVNFE